MIMSDYEYGSIGPIYRYFSHQHSCANTLGIYNLLGCVFLRLYKISWCYTDDSYKKRDWDLPDYRLLRVFPAEKTFKILDEIYNETRIIYRNNSRKGKKAILKYFYRGEFPLHCVTCDDFVMELVGLDRLSDIALKPEMRARDSVFFCMRCDNDLSAYIKMRSKRLTGVSALAINAEQKNMIINHWLASKVNRLALKKQLINERHNR